ncbi:CocE/NonD family hydrolase [Nocardia transvalensis]|uniref:CocE/NonD family hydrolase n=1 Tax=Nocardia transvalensis TaxID=37333 RepID=UPI0018959217|nr:CocE/NonD family hydrolase [Nocardia transvalensis]MBF6331084.1 CocE/NonD family hydrolase [Nocardia transvalensis]
MKRFSARAAVIALALTLGATAVIVRAENAVAESAAELPSASTAGLLPAGWIPGPELYGVGLRKNMEIKASDGTVLRADVRFPTDATGQQAAGRFPVIVTMTPYGKDSESLMDALSYNGIGPIVENSPLSKLLPGGMDVLKYLADAAGWNDYLVKRGYIQVIADVRGTGTSEGQWGVLQPQEQDDTRAVIDWAAHLSGSNGKVGMSGLSYLGMTQLLAAKALDKDSPVKAMFPMMPGNSLYEDLISHDGYYVLLFGLSVGPVPQGWLPLVIDPLLGLHDQPEKLLKVVWDHVLTQLDPNSYLQMAINLILNGDKRYNEQANQERAIDGALAKVVENGIAVYQVSGSYDLLQNGTPLNYSGMQNLLAGRPQHEAMAPGQTASGKYQTLIGPWPHLVPGLGLGGGLPDIDLHQIELAWFDRWLKDIPNGIDNTSTPLHAITDDGKLLHSATYPVQEAPAATYYLNSQGRLSTTAPTDPDGADRLQFHPAEAALCSRSMEQEFIGFTAITARLLNLPSPCTTGPTFPGDHPTYETQPFDSDSVLSGPIGLSLMATSDRPNAAFSVEVTDVAPDGSVQAVTEGQLLGTHRTLDEDRCWRTGDGSLQVPAHTNTRESLRAVPIGVPTEYDIKVRPAQHIFPAGHRLRLTIGTGDFPIYILPPEDYPALIGSTQQILHNSTYKSKIVLPLASTTSFAR